ncbi:MAG: DUF4159 domain-containing protein [Flavobacteriales bacterium]|nr:DUF4159 domain-containing protein [Flavobacteriales bacterium]
MRNLLILILGLFFTFAGYAQNGPLRIAKLKYSGGGDWYSARTALPNLIKFCNQQLGTSIDPLEATVEPGSKEIFNYPYVFMTGHGTFLLSDQEADNMRNYLMAGGFLHIDDNYGLDPHVRPQLKKVFPELDFVELPFTHPIFHQTYQFNDGLPKIHEHDGKPAQAFGLLFEGKLVCLYTYECDLGNGWEDAGIHGDSESKRLSAFKMGANILQYVFMK